MWAELFLKNEKTSADPYAYATNAVPETVSGKALRSRGFTALGGAFKTFSDFGSEGLI